MKFTDRFSGKKQLKALRAFWETRPFLDPFTVLVYLVLGISFFLMSLNIPLLIQCIMIFAIGYFIDVERAFYYCEKNNINLD